MRFYGEQISFFKHMPDCVPLAQLDGSSGAVLFVDSKNPYKTPMLIRPNGEITNFWGYFNLEAEDMVATRLSMWKVDNVGVEHGQCKECGDFIYGPPVCPVCGEVVCGVCMDEHLEVKHGNL